MSKLELYPHGLVIFIFFGCFLITGFLIFINKLLKCINTHDENVFDSEEEEEYTPSSYYTESENDFIQKDIQTKQIKTFSNINKYPKFCPICQEDKLDTIKTNCNHDFCKGCIEDYIKTNCNYNCPVCRKNIQCIYEVKVLIFK